MYDLWQGAAPVLVLRALQVLHGLLDLLAPPTRGTRTVLVSAQSG